MRRLYVIIAIVVVLVVAGVLAVLLGNVDKYRPQVQAELQKKLDCPVTLGHLHMRLLPFSIRVDGLTIGEPPEFPAAQPFATAKEVYARAGLLSLIRGNPDVKELDLDQPSIELIRNPAGVWNFSTIGGANKNSNQSDDFTLGELKINGGQIAVIDEATKGAPSVYDHIDARVTGLGRGKVIDGQFSVKDRSVAVLTGTFSVDNSTSKLTYSAVVNIPNASFSMKSLSGPLVIKGGNLHVNQDGAAVTVNSLTAQGFVLTNVRANAKFGTDFVELSPVSTGIFGGRADGTISVNTKQSTPVCSINMNISGVDANALLAAVSSTKNTLSGNVAGQMNVSFALQSGANLARTLNGTLNFNVTNGQLKNVNIMNELARVGKFLGSAPAQGGSATALKKFSGTMNIVNGVATTNNLVAVLDAGSLSANGSLNLVNEAIDLHMTAVLSSGSSQSVGGTQVGGFLNTALANNKGELVIPVLVTGTLEHPVITPDVQAIAKMKLSNLLPTSDDPTKLTPGGLLKGILGQGASQPGQQNPINSLLNQFGKKKKP